MSRAASRFPDPHRLPHAVRRRTLLRRPGWMLVGALSLVLAGCGGEKAAGGAGAGAGPGGARPTAVTTVRLQPEAFADSLVATGTVKARESVTVTAKVSEIVQTVHFDSGQEVRAGAPLITLSDRQQQASLAEAQAAADDAERLYRRQSELAQQQLIARSQLDNQRAVRDAAQARIAQIRAQLADRVIRAPFSGVLGLRQVSPGALVTPGVAIATLDDLSRVYVDFPLPESQLSRIAPGQHIRGHVVAYPDRTFDGVVSTVDARIDPATRAVQVRADFANVGRPLRPGMLMTVDVASAERQALLLPEMAVTQIGADSFVFRVKPDDSVEQAKVTLAARRDGKVEIASGLAAGDRIVIDGAGKLRPDGKISEAGAGKAPATAPTPAPAGR